MDEPPAKSRSSSAAWSALIVVVPLIYVLSVGPVAYVALRLSMYNAAVAQARTFYAPVIWLHDHTFLKEPLNGYLEWWESLGRRP